MPFFRMGFWGWGSLRSSAGTWLRGRADQAAGRQIGEQRAGAEGPGRRLVAEAHAVDQGAEPVRGDHDDVVALVREAAAGAVAVLGRGEHRAQEQGDAVGVLVVLADRLADEVEYVAADPLHGAGAVQHEA